MAIVQELADSLKNGGFDFILAHDETSATDGTWKGFVLAEDDNRRKMFEISRAPFIGQRVSSGRITTEDRDPQSHLVWRQDDWSGGALVESTRNVENGYLRGSMDARFPGQLAPGIARNFGGFHGNTTAPIGVLLLNPNFEAPSGDDGWTDDSAANGTVDFQATDDFRDDLFGAQSCKITATGAADMISQTLANPSVYQSKDLKFSFYWKESSGAGITAEIDDGVGTTDGTTVTAATDWTLVTVTRTIDASATQVKLIIKSSGAVTGWADDASVYGTTADLATTRIVEHSGNKYTTFGQFVCQLATSSEDAFRWNAVYMHASANATDIQPFDDSGGNNHVFVAFGASQAYIYGSTTSWTASTLTGTSDNAIKFAVSRNSLWKSETVNTVKSATNPLNGGSWSSAYTVGTVDHEIVRLYGHADTVLVAKEDGLWQYRRTYNDGTSADLFENRTAEFAAAPSTDNFREGHEHFDGSLYMNTSAPGFSRFTGTVLQSLDTFAHPEADAKGVVRALAGDVHQLWCFVDDDLYSVKHDSGRLIAHTPCPSPSVSSRSSVEFAPSQSNTGATSPGATANRNSDGGPTGIWSNTGNITSSNDSYATNTTGGAPVDHLQATTFGFAVPSNAVIDGIKVTIERKGGTGLTDSDLKLLKEGSAVGNSKADTLTAWPATDTSKDYGGTSDLWGETWSPTTVNDSGFGVELSVLNNGVATASVDHITITVYYTLLPSSAIQMRTAAVVYWAISSVATQHLLGTMAGIDANDNVPYALTDCWALSRDSISPTLQDDNLPWSPTTHQFFTSRHDFGQPTETKVASHIDIRLKEMDATQALTVKFGVNGADGNTTTLGTMSGSGAVQTLYFGDITDAEDATSFTDIGLYFEGTYTGSRNKRIVSAFELHAYPAPHVTKVFSLTARIGGVGIGDAGMTLQDDMPDQSRKQLRAFLDALEDRDFSFYLIEDFDGDGEPTSHVVTFRPATRRETPAGDGTQPADGLNETIVLQTADNKE